MGIIRTIFSIIPASLEKVAPGSRAWWDGTRTDIGGATDSKLIRTLVKCSRISTLVILFHTGLFRPCTKNLKITAEADNDGLKSKCQRQASYMHQLACSVPINRAFSKYMWTIAFVYCWWIILSLVTISLDLNALSSYRYLDCYILGRFTFNARVSQPVKINAFVLILGVLTFRFRVVFRKAGFSLPVFEFMHRDLASVAKNHCGHQEARSQSMCPKCNNSRAKIVPPQLGRWCSIRAGHERTAAPRIRFGQLLNQLGFSNRLSTTNQHCNASGTDDFASPHNCDDVMFVKSLCVRNEFHVIRKINRSPAYWFRLNVCMLYWTLFCIVFWLCWFIWVIYVMTTTIVTKRGFEFTYPNCVSYIRDYVNEAGVNRTQRAKEYESIYDASKPSCGDERSTSLQWIQIRDVNLKGVPIILPMEDFATGPYHLVRIVCDYITSLALLVDSMCFLIGHGIMCLQLIIDIVLNSWELHERLVRLRNNRWLGSAEERRIGATTGNAIFDDTLSNEELIHSNSCGRSLLLSHRVKCRHPSYCNRHIRTVVDPSESSKYGSASYSTNDAAALNSETILLQDLILDQFKTTGMYDDYFSWMSSFMVCFFLAISFTTLAMLSVIVSETTMYDLYFALASICGVLILYLIIASIICSFHRSFYPIISSLMAMEKEQTDKFRWLTILDHYHQTPMYCFTLMSTEISSSLVLRVISWAVSALSVVIGLFYERIARLKLMISSNHSPN